MRSSLESMTSAVAVFLSFGVFLGACASLKKAETSSAQSPSIIELIWTELPFHKEPDVPKDLRRALKALNESQYEEALALFERYMWKEPTSPYTQSAQLNAGRALEGLGRWSEAIERYRSVAVATEGVAPKLQAMALYRMAFCYEALGEDQLNIATLIDVSNRSAYLPEEVATAEVPARLAASYARAGNFDMALKYYNAAERGIVRLKRLAAEDKEKMREWLPRTLYYMGTMSLRRVSWDDFESALRPLAYGQTYLLESAEWGMEPWSDRAAKDLISFYSDLWRVIETAPVPTGVEDPVVARREVQARQWARSASVMEYIQELRARIPPQVLEGGAPSSSQVKTILEFLSALDGRIEKLLAQRPAGEGLTPESLERLSRIRGQVISPDDSLERIYIESLRKSRSESPALDQDPNL